MLWTATSHILDNFRNRIIANPLGYILEHFGWFITSKISIRKNTYLATSNGVHTWSFFGSANLQFRCRKITLPVKDINTNLLTSLTPAVNEINTNMSATMTQIGKVIGGDLCHWWDKWCSIILSCRDHKLILDILGPF